MAENPRVNSRDDARNLLAGRVFFATVADTSGANVQIVRQGTTVPDASYYPAADGLAAAVTAGDRVLCVYDDGVVNVVVKMA